MFCYKCGKENEDNSNYCYSCGTKLNNYVEVANHLLGAVIVTVFCFSLTGIIAIIFSLLVDKYNKLQDEITAGKFAKLSLIFIWISFGIGIFLWIIIIFVIILGVFVSKNNQQAHIHL